VSGEEQKTSEDKMRNLFSIWHFIFFVIALGGVLAPDASAAWSGPRTTVAAGPNKNLIQICPQGSSICVTGLPFYLTLNTQVTAIQNNDWSQFDYELKLLAQWFSPSRTAGALPLVSVHLLNTSTSFLDKLVQHLKAYSSPYLIVRVPTENNPNLPLAVGSDFWDTSLQGAIAGNTITTSWINFQIDQVKKALTYLDQKYPGKIVGVMLGSEWFTVPRYLGADSVWHDIKTGPNLTPPWDSISSNSRIPDFFYGDTSSSSASQFCAWWLLPSSLTGAGCHLPQFAARNNTFAPRFSANGVFLDTNNREELNAIYFSRFQAHQVVNAITRILASAKTLTNNNIMTMAFYGYLYATEWNHPNMGHMALSKLLASPSIDAIVGPYSYTNARSLGNPFLAQGVMDSPALHNKIWITEDDTKTHLALLEDKDNCPNGPGNDFCNSENLWDTARFIRRNMITAAMHRTGQYFLDLWLHGWWGRMDHDSDSQQMWANASTSISFANQLNFNSTHSFKPQVAVFTDDISESYLALVDPAGKNTYDLGMKRLSLAAREIEKMGTPVRHYLLSDLLLTNFPYQNIKLAIFLNAYNVPQNIRDAIAQKLKKGNRKLVFLYASGIYKGDVNMGSNGITDLTGIQVAQGNYTKSSLSIYTSGVPTGLGLSYSLNPWYYVSDQNVDVYGFYGTSPSTITERALVGKKFTGIDGTPYTVFYSAAPNLNAHFYWYLGYLANVRSLGPWGDTIEASGNSMMIHVSDNNAGTKRITLPWTVPAIYEIYEGATDKVLCTNCNSFELYMNPRELHVYHWQ
jgi:hypothetical protein